MDSDVDAAQLTEAVGGPPAWRNWKRFNEGAERLQGFELPLYGDAAMVSELRSVGPFDILNAISRTQRTSVTAEPVLVLRVFLYEQLYRSEITVRTDTSDYHGVAMPDEIASVIAVSLGRRLRSGGGPTRYFLEHDALGTPVGFMHAPPYLPSRVDGHQTLPLVRKESSVDLAQDDLLRYQKLNRRKAMAFSKAASAYSQALWIADESPGEAWLRLVTSLETLANDYFGSVNGIEFEELAPETVSLLRKSAKDEAAYEALHRLIAPGTRSTNKFIRFCQQFMPEAPKERPTLGAIDWDRMKSHLGAIYDARSKALHAGAPIPPPMCAPPELLTDGEEIYNEAPLGPSAASGGHWLVRDIPMLLQTFERITRSIMLGWLRDASESAAKQD